VRNATANDFDEKNTAQLETTLAQLGKLLTIKLITVLDGGFLADSQAEAQAEAFAVSKNALDVLVSALQMARQRAVAETGCLLRLALEISGTALHVSRDDEAYLEYTKGKYKSTRAISFAKDHLPVINKIWGLLSSAAVHVTQFVYGPVFEPDENGCQVPTVSLEFAIREQRPSQDRLSLSLISLVAAVVLGMTELVFFEEDKKLRRWLKLSGTGLRSPYNSDALISRYLEEINAIAQMEERLQEQPNPPSA
jgi:hypothetical protein